MATQIGKFNLSLSPEELYGELEPIITGSSFETQLPQAMIVLLTEQILANSKNKKEENLSTEFATNLIDKIAMHNQANGVSQSTAIKEIAYQTMEEIEKHTGVPIGNDRKKKLLTEISEERTNDDKREINGHANDIKQRIIEQTNTEGLNEIRYLSAGIREFHRLNGDSSNLNAYNNDALTMLGKSVSQPSADIELAKRAQSEGIPVAGKITV